MIAQRKMHTSESIHFKVNMSSVLIIFQNINIINADDFSAKSKAEFVAGFAKARVYFCALPLAARLASSPLNNSD